MRNLDAVRKISTNRENGSIGETSIAITVRGRPLLPSIPGASGVPFCRHGREGSGAVRTYDGHVVR